MADEGWDKHALRIFKFAGVAVVFLVVIFLVISSIVTPTVFGGATSSYNTIQNVVAAFSNALNTLANPIFLIALLVVLVLIAVIALKAMNKI